MKQNEDGMYELTPINIDEFLYRHFNSTSRGLFWRFRMRLKWKLETLIKRMRPSTEVMNFLHKDLQSLHYTRMKGRIPLRLRFFTKTGELKSGRFIVSFRFSRYIIKEAKYPSIRKGKPLKGPMTTKAANCISKHITPIGFRRTWEIYYSSTL